MLTTSKHKEEIQLSEQNLKYQFFHNIDLQEFVDFLFFYHFTLSKAIKASRAQGVIECEKKQRTIKENDSRRQNITTYITFGLVVRKARSQKRFSFLQ